MRNLNPGVTHRLGGQEKEWDPLIKLCCYLLVKITTNGANARLSYKLERARGPTPCSLGIPSLLCPVKHVSTSSLKCCSSGEL